MELKEMTLEQLTFEKLNALEIADSFYKSAKEIDREIDRRYKEGDLKRGQV